MSESVIFIVMTAVNVGVVAAWIGFIVWVRREDQRAAMECELLDLLPPDRALLDHLRYRSGITIVGPDPDRPGEARLVTRTNPDVCTAMYGAALIGAGTRLMVEHGADVCGAGE